MRLRVAVCDSQPDTLSRMERFLVDTKLVSCVTCYNNIRELRDELKCRFRINGAPFSRQRCKRLAPAVCCPFIACL